MGKSLRSEAEVPGDLGGEWTRYWLRAIIDHPPQWHPTSALETGHQFIATTEQECSQGSSVCGVDGITNVFLYQVDNSINFRYLKVHNGHTKKGTLFLDKGHSPLFSSPGMALHIFIKVRCKMRQWKLSWHYQSKKCASMSLIQVWIVWGIQYTGLVKRMRLYKLV